MRRAHRTSHAWLAVAIVAALGPLAAPIGAVETDDHAQADEAQAPDTHEGAGERDAHGQRTEPAGDHGEHADQAVEHAEAFAGHHVHTEHRNGLGVYLGETLVTAEDQAFFTFGFEYERLLADRWALQVIVEHVNDYDAWVVMAPVGFRLGSTLWALAGPGFESEARRTGLENGRHEPEPHVEGHSVEPHEDESPCFLWRFGLTYGIHLGHSGRFSVFPSLNLDLVREHGEWEKAWVLGVGVSYHF